MSDVRAPGQVVVGRLIASQFPELNGEDVTWLGQGIDNYVFLVGEEWIFRFPQRADRIAWQAREEEILRLAFEALGPLVPEVRFRGEPTPEFPFPFIGYRRLPGQAAESSRVLPAPADLGPLLARLHGSDPSRVPPTPDRWEEESLHTEQAELVELADVVRPLLGQQVRELTEPYLQGRVRPPESSLEPRFCHNDITAEHILVSPDGVLTGLIDWTDAMVTDPAVDFAGLITVAGWPYIQAALDAYPLSLDEQFGERLVWLTRTLSLRWLADAAASGETELHRHLGWVDRAFGPSGLNPIGAPPRKM